MGRRWPTPTLSGAQNFFGGVGALIVGTQVTNLKKIYIFDVFEH